MVVRAALLELQREIRDVAIVPSESLRVTFVMFLDLHILEVLPYYPRRQKLCELNKTLYPPLPR